MRRKREKKTSKSDREKLDEYVALIVGLGC
jgi:hypothetical protein